MKRSCCWMLGVGVLLAGQPALASRTLGELRFEPCTLSSPGTPVAREAQCTRFKVPEDRAARDGRMLELNIAWVPATGEAEPDPVFFLAGGPGQAATEAWPQMAGAFEDVNRTRHLILVDQRGTGQSNPLHCGSDADAVTDAPSAGAELRAYAAEQARRCLQQYEGKADVRHYTTTDAVADLDAVRKAIAARQINLLGVSYGTRVAQQYAKTYPQATRSIVLDSPISTTLVLGSEHARNVDEALRTQFARCAADATCKARMGDLPAQLEAVRARLAGGHLEAVRYRDSVTAEWSSEVPQTGHLAVLLRMYSYQSLTAAALPLVVHQADQDDWVPLLAQARTLTRSLTAQLAHGMELSVLCSEDGDELRVDPADAGTLLGSEFLEVLTAQCEVWPRGQRPADFRTPLSGAVPVLILSGELDPVTPPRYAEAIARELPNSLHLSLRGQGHAQLGVGCTPKLYAQFTERASVKDLNTQCLERVQPAPPFTGLYGWDP